MNYPSLDLDALQRIKELRAHFDADPEFLTKPECPYSIEVRELLRDMFTVRVETVAAAADRGAKQRGRKPKNPLSDEQATVVEEEAIALLTELKGLKPPAGSKFDSDTKIQIIKAKTALIDKVVAIQERFFNVRKVANFQKVVIDILTDLIPEDNRAEFLKRLEPYL